MKSLKYNNKTTIQNIAEWCIVMWQVFQGCLRCKQGLKDSFDTFLFNVNIRTATSLASNAHTTLVLYCRRVSMVNLQNEQFLSVQPFLFETFHSRDKNQDCSDFIPIVSMIWKLILYAKYYIIGIKTIKFRDIGKSTSLY